MKDIYSKEKEGDVIVRITARFIIGKYQKKIVKFTFSLHTHQVHGRTDRQTKRLKDRIHSDDQSAQFVEKINIISSPLFLLFL